MKVRLNKYLTLCGLGSRRKVEDFITSGLIKINGEVVRELGSVIDTETDKVFFKDSELVASEKKYYLILNKPEGFVTTLSDEKGRPTVMDLIPEKFKRCGVIPVGRLDKDTEGLLLFTNDGDLAYRLTRPEFKVPKEYSLILNAPLAPEHKKIIEKGYFVHQIKIKTASAKVELENERGDRVKITIMEGKKRQVRYTFGNLGYKVLKLRRVGLGPLRLGNIAKGEHRLLKNYEIKALMESAKPVKFREKKY